MQKTSIKDSDFSETRVNKIDADQISFLAEKEQFEVVHIDGHFRIYQRAVKPTLDFLMASIGLVILSPLFLIVGIAIKLDSKGPVFFRQERAITSDKPFMIYKFRTMSTEAPSRMATRELQNAESYITTVGSFLRKTSVDELPQLINVLKGQMSLIGPRPLVMTEINLLDQRKRMEIGMIRPGITGLAQVKGRDLVTDLEKVRLDYEYYRNCSIVEDLKVTLQTLIVVAFHIGVREGKQG